MIKQLEEKDVDFEEIKKNLDFTASLLEAVYLDGTRYNIVERYTVDIYCPFLVLTVQYFVFAQ